MSLNRFLLLVTPAHTGTHFTVAVTEAMDNVLRMSDPPPKDGSSPDYFAYRVGHPIQIFNPDHEKNLDFMLERNIYVLTSMRHPIRRMGTFLRQRLIMEIERGIHENRFDETIRNYIKDLWFKELENYRKFLENVHRLNEKGQANFAINYIDQMNLIESDEERIKYMKDRLKMFEFKWSDKAESQVRRNPTVNTGRERFRKFKPELQKQFNDYYDQITDGIFNKKLVDGIDWRTPFKALCESILIEECHGYGEIPFTIEEFGKLPPQEPLPLRTVG